MSEKLLRLFNTLNRIDVKGESVLFMADCLRFLDQLIQECKAAENETTKEVVNDGNTAETD